MIKRKVLFLFLIGIHMMLFLLSEAIAQDKKFGIGVVLGSPTGLSAKWFLSDQSALDFDLAFDFLGAGFLSTVDYLYHFSDLLDDREAVIRPYVGGGGIVGARRHKDNDDDNRKSEEDDDFKTTVGFGGRFTGGISFFFTKVSIELFIDISPGIWLFPATDFYWGGVIGARYFF